MPSTYVDTPTLSTLVDIKGLAEHHRHSVPFAFMTSLSVNFPEAESDELRRAAAADGVSLADFVRHATRDRLHRCRVRAATSRSVDALAAVNERLADR